MSAGNAWAQMKAKEMELQKGDPEKGKSSLISSLSACIRKDQRQKTKTNLRQEPTPKPLATRKAPGLDYDSELALPIPKPRHARPEDEPSPSSSKSNLFTMPNVTKKRSTTEPSGSTERNSKAEAAEKKKSKVASLRSKFSLKDIGKEFRKEIPPLSSMPKLGGSSSNEFKRTDADADAEDPDKSAHNFNEAKLYVPKTRTGDVHPKSAPPQTSEFHDAASVDKQSVDSIISCLSMQTPTKISEDGKTDSQAKHDSNNNDVSQASPIKHLETLLLDGSSPPARTGACNNTGQPEFIQVPNRISSMKAENNESTAPRSPHTPPPIPLSDATIYSPSNYSGTPKKVTKKVSKCSLLEKDNKISHPFIVSSSDYKEKSYQPLTEDQFFMEPREPPLPPPIPPRSRAREQVKSNLDEGQFFAGVTSHGGYAPPPPHPGYQNTVTLEQQLASHVDSLHHHMSAAVNRLTRTFENGNNWSNDQTLKQLDSVFDILRVTQARAATQADMMHELARSLMAREETLVLEINKLRTEVGELIRVMAGTSKAQTLAQPQHQHQSLPQPQPQGVKRFAHQKNRKSQASGKRDHWSLNNNNTKAAENKKSAAENPQQSKSALEPQAEPTAVKEPQVNVTADNIPTPTAAFRTPRPDGATPIPAKREVPEKNGESSAGSPKSKAAKLNISAPIPITTNPQVNETNKHKSLESNNNQPGTPHRESTRKPRNVFSSDDLKTPKKKGGMFSFRRKPEGDNQSGNSNRFQILTPRRSKEGKSVHSEESQSPRVPVSTPTKPRGTPFSTRSLASSASNDPPVPPGHPGDHPGAQIRREESPSLVHPALRTPHQKQVMADRERRLAQLNRQLQSPGHGHPLRASQSHQGFGGSRDSAVTSSHPSFVSYGPRDPSYSSAMSMSMSTSVSSFRDMNHYPAANGMHYPPPHPAGPSPLAQAQGAGVGEQPQYFPSHPQPLLPGPGPVPGPASEHGQGPAPAPVSLPASLPAPIPNNPNAQFDGLEWYSNGNGQIEGAVFPGGNFF